MGWEPIDRNAQAGVLEYSQGSSHPCLRGVVSTLPDPTGIFRRASPHDEGRKETTDPLPSNVSSAMVSERGSTSTAARMAPSSPRTPQWFGGSKQTSSAVSSRSEKPMRRVVGQRSPTYAEMEFR